MLLRLGTYDTFLRSGPLTRLLSRRLLRMVLGILILIEAIFIAESFTSLMRIVAENGGSFGQLAFNLLLKSPEIFDFALPLALMLGVFFAITGARDDNELVVCAAAGIPGGRVLLFAFAVGVLGFVVSIAFAGFVTPTAKYLSRVSGHQLEAQRIKQHLVSPGSRRLIHSVDGQTVVAVPAVGGESAHGNLFFFEEMADGSWRFSQSDDWFAEGPLADGSYKVQLQTYREYFGGPPRTGPATEDAQGSGALRDQLRVQANSVDLDVNLDTLIPVFDPTVRFAERLMPEHVTLPTDGGLLLVPNTRFAEILMRGLLCPIAAMLAAAAAVWSGGGLGRYLALPVLTVAVLGCDVFARAMVVASVDQGAAAFWVTTCGITLAGLALPGLYLTWMREAIIRPARRS